jgi:metal transporter CNNM
MRSRKTLRFLALLAVLPFVRVGAKRQRGQMTPVEERVLQAIALLETSVVESSLKAAERHVQAKQRPCHVGNSSFDELSSRKVADLWSESTEQISVSTKQAIEILRTIKDELRAEEQDDRHLEDGKEYNADDDYIDFYSFYKGRSDVSVSYDSSENTVVTVDEGVIVVIEYTIGHYLYNGMMALACILVGATMAGLLMGVMTLDPLFLGIKMRTANTELERRRARNLLPFVQNKNLVLVSVLLVNCGVNESLPIFLEALLDNPFVTVVLSLTVVLVVGEILPSAYFTGRDQISTASHFIPVLRVVIFITSPISFPLAKLMDHYFQHSDEGSAFKRGEIGALVRIQYEQHLAWKRRHAGIKNASVEPDKNRAVSPTLNNCNLCEPLDCVMYDQEDLVGSCVPKNQCFESSPSMHHGLEDDDILKLEGALAMKDKKVAHSYTPMKRVFSVTADTVLDEEKVVQIYGRGFSRIPVFSRDEHGVDGVCGILLTKQLMLVRKKDRRLVSSMILYEPPCVSPDASLAETMGLIQAGSRKSSNMALVCLNPELARISLKRKKTVPNEAGVLGIITLENVLEELIQEQIYDEKDKKMNPTMERAKWAFAKWKVFALKKRMQQDTSLADMDDDFYYVKMKEIV